ncbi:hypothetical protein M426DRAFT_47885, partial [Hypoxylon sp. CI-4A]
LLIPAVLALATSTQCANFAYEDDQLTEADIGNFSAIAFGNTSTATPLYNVADCRAYPGSESWPSEAEWAQLNATLQGALIRATPPAAVCYNGTSMNSAQCSYLIFNASSARFYIDDPVTQFSEWPEGDTCHRMPSAGESCTQGAFPVYVVNATAVRHVQAAVNFARNRNLRLVIKNTGHDLIGRSVGFGGLSIWTHYLKDFQYLPRYSVGEYRGKAAKVGSGIESWEMFAHMDTHNATMLVAGGYTVGAYGGWITGGGHSALASKYGLGADQVLSLRVVTADGKFVTADPEQNTDLFYALRGGGGGTYGVVTSAVIKAHPYTTVTTSAISYFVGGFNASTPAAVEMFWKGFDVYHKFGNKIVNERIDIDSYVSKEFGGDTSFHFTTDIELPDVSGEYLSSFAQPFIDDLKAIGLNVTVRAPYPASNWGAASQGRGDTPASTRFGSRLFPRENFEDPDLFIATQKAIRESVEAGYTFHGIHMVPTEDVAGYPGNNAVNPAFRKTIMHADLFDYTPQRGLSPTEFQASHALLASYLDKWRAVSPGAGAYFNECDLEEPNWQQAFFGTNYEKLLAIKKDRDPWGLFYAPATVGSEDWVVVTEDGLPTQNGPLCGAGSEV